MPGRARGQRARRVEPGHSAKLQGRSAGQSCSSEGRLRKPNVGTTVCTAGPCLKPGPLSYPAVLSGILGDEAAKTVALGVEIPAL